MKFIAYYRVSTISQGQSGLGLESQRQDILRYVESINGEIIETYTDVETGKNDSRENLWAAVEACSKHGATLIVKKFDRLSRGGIAVMAKLEELSVNYIESDSPHDNTVIKEIKFALSKEEGKKISERTKAALAVIKEKVQSGVGHVSKSGRVVTSLGSPQNLSDVSRAKSAEVRREKARKDPKNVEAYRLIKIFKDSGMSFYMIAIKLNEVGVLNRTGKPYHHSQVKRIYEMYQ